MKTYYLTLSKMFPKGHRSEGKPTNFEEKVKNGVKFHTIRANYEFWRERFEKIKKGEACLSIRQWVGTPYGRGSTQREIARLTKDDGIGLQMLEFRYDNIYLPIIDDRCMYYPSEIAEKDGLSVEDWLDWFKDYDLSKPMAIIHFRNWRYNR